MDKASHLARYLEHTNSMAVVRIINSGVMSFPVSATSARNKRTAKGVSIAGLLEMTTNRASVSPGYVIVLK